MKQLLYSGVDVNIKNLEGKKAGDILAQQTQVENSKIKVMLWRAGALPSSSISQVSYYAQYLWNIFSRLEKSRLHFISEWIEISDDRRNVLLVVATLLLTVTYQGVLKALLGDFGKMIIVLEPIKPIPHFRPLENSIQVLLLKTKQGHPLVLETFLFGCSCR